AVSPASRPGRTVGADGLAESLYRTRRAFLQDRLGCDDAALRRAYPCVLEQPAFHHTRPQEFPDQIEELAVLDAMPEELHELPVIDRIKRSHNMMPLSRTQRRPIRKRSR